MGIPLATLEATHQAHYEAATKQEKDPDGGSYPAYPSGKSWDTASGKTGSGKKFFHNVIPGSAVKTEQFFVAIITPVIHYCMGGLEIDEVGAVLDTKGKVIRGLYAAGEIAGGVHGNNRLGGNSLLDCVVFGRVTGIAACKYMLGADMKPVNLADISGGGLSGEVKGSKLAGGSYEDNLNETSAKGVEKSAGGGKSAASGAKSYTLAEVATHNKKGDCWVVLNGRVLNVSSFLSEHPGGELAILTFAGKDATEEFDMIHPPDVVGKYAPNAIIGVVGDGSAAAATGDAPSGGQVAAAPAASAGGHKPRNWAKSAENRKKRMEGEGKIGGWLGAICYMVLGFMKEIIFTIFGQKKISS